MNNYLADTMAIVLYLEHRKLPSSVKSLFDGDSKEDMIYISSITLMEIGYLYEKSRIETSVSDVIRLTERNPRFAIYPINQKTIIQAFEITDIPELHDRMIAGSGASLNATIVTNDPIIRKSRHVRCLW